MRGEGYACRIDRRRNGGIFTPPLPLQDNVKRKIRKRSFIYRRYAGLESKLVPQEKSPFESIDITGFRRKLSLDNVKTIMRFSKA